MSGRRMVVNKCKISSTLKIYENVLNSSMDNYKARSRYQRKNMKLSFFNHNLHPASFFIIIITIIMEYTMKITTVWMIYIKFPLEKTISIFFSIVCHLLVIFSCSFIIVRMIMFYEYSFYIVAGLLFSNKYLPVTMTICFRSDFVSSRVQ